MYDMYSMYMCSCRTCPTVQVATLDAAGRRYAHRVCAVHALGHGLRLGPVRPGADDVVACLDLLA